MFQLIDFETPERRKAYKAVSEHEKELIEREAEALRLLRSLGWVCSKPQFLFGRSS